MCGDTRVCIGNAFKIDNREIDICGDERCE